MAKRYFPLQDQYALAVCIMQTMVPYTMHSNLGKLVRLMTTTPKYTGTIALSQWNVIIDNLKTGFMSIQSSYAWSTTSYQKLPLQPPYQA